MNRIGVALWLALALGAGAARADDAPRTISLGGVERSYLLHLPPAAASGAPLPLVVVLHGAGGNARVIAEQTHFSEEADWSDFVVAYPNGSKGAAPSRALPPQPALVWNAGRCCKGASDQPSDDVAFVRAMVEAVAREVPIDRRRIYAAGMSNGGMMSYRLACEASDLFAAVGVVSGALMTESCRPSEPVSVIHVHGTDDKVVPIEGGPGQPLPPGDVYPSAESAIAFWRAANGCDSSPLESVPGIGARLFRYAGCRAGSEVGYCVLGGGKHSWPGAGRISVLFPPATEAIAATPLIWQFFASHPKSAEHRVPVGG